MSRSFILTSLAVMLATLSVPALAQRTGTRLGHDASQKDALVAMDLLASCAVERRPDIIRSWLDMLPGTNEEHQLLQGWSADLTACTYSSTLVLDGKELAFQPSAMRLPVALFAARNLLRKLPQSTQPVIASDPWFMQLIGGLASNVKIDRLFLTLQDFGHCVASKDWSGARQLVSSLPASPEEKSAVDHLIPVLGPCLVEGSTIELTPAKLRSYLAEPVYHILIASNPEAAAAPR